MSSEAVPRQLIANNPVQQEVVISHIIAGRSVKEICDITGIGRDRIRRWIYQDDDFAEMFQAVANEVRQQIRLELVTDLVGELGDMIPDALEALRDGLNPVNRQSDRTSAANSVLRLAGVGVQTKGPSGAVDVDALLKKYGGADGAAARGPATGD